MHAVRKTHLHIIFLSMRKNNSAGVVYQNANVIMQHEWRSYECLQSMSVTISARIIKFYSTNEEKIFRIGLIDV